jgi:hypothetical protein
MSEYDLMQVSPFMWIDPFGKGSVMMAGGFNGFCLVAKLNDQFWVAFVKPANGRVRVVSIGEKVHAMAASDDFLREIEESSAANKNKRWLSQGASDKQKQLLRAQGIEVSPMDFSWTKYRANCTLNYFWNKKVIDHEYKKAEAKVRVQ